jgi:putative transposase
MNTTSADTFFTPYWNASCQTLSQRLLLSTETDCVDSDLILSRLFSKSLDAKSWFSKKLICHQNPNSSKTYYPSFTFSHAAFMDSENTVVRSKKIRIYPKDRQLARKYFGLSRYWYNTAVAYLKQDGVKARLAGVRSVAKIEHPDWATDCPQRIREHAFSDACLANKNAKSKGKKTGVFQNVSFRKKRDAIQGFGFDKISLKQCFVFGEKIRKLVFHASEEIRTELEGTRIVREDNRYFVVVPQRRRVKVPETQRLGDVAIDPGVRTFATLFSESITGKIGEGDFRHIFRLCLGLDNLYSQMSKASCKQKRNMKRAAQRLRWRIYDLIDDMHKKTAHFLVTTFDRIFLPSFETSKMVTKLRSKVARSMLTFAHFRFKQFLKCKAEEYSCLVVDCNEAYTSRTCSYCGKIQKIGSKKRMVCECGANVDRDLNGGRGIYLRSLSAMTPLEAGNC